MNKILSLLIIVLLLVACNTQVITAPITEKLITFTVTSSPHQAIIQVTATNTPLTESIPTAKQIDQPTATAKRTKRPTWTNEPPQPSETIESTYTRGPSPTTVPTNTPTLTSTSTPCPPLAKNGPYLLYLAKLSGDVPVLVVLNADTSGRRIIPLPEELDISKSPIAISSNGEWLAFHTGSFDPKSNPSGPFNLTLKLMYLPNGHITTVTHLLSPDYPANLDKVAKFLIENDPEYVGYDLNGTLSSVTDLFTGGIRALAWSPNSRYLAFAGEMDGPTSDLYVYDTEDQTITRLTDGYGQMTGAIRWSPDGKWIAHTATNEPPQVQWASNIYIARADGSETKDLGPSMYFHGWVAPDTIRLSEAANGVGDYNTRNVNVETGEVTSLWTDGFSDYAIDLEDGSAAICGYGYFDRTIQSGLYLIRPNGTHEHIMSIDYCFQLAYRGSHAHRFVIANRDKGVLGVSKDGLVTTISSKFGWIHISPNYKWLLLTNGRLEGNISTIELYDENDNFVRQLTTDEPSGVFWRPDSLGIYFIVGERLYYVPPLNGDPVLVEQNLVSTGQFFQWIWAFNNIATP